MTVRVRSTARSLGRRGASFLSATVLLVAAAALARQSDEEIDPAKVALGERLFQDLNFTNQAADYGASCAGCHATGSSIQGRTARAWNDYTPTSLTAKKATTLRNTPSLLGSASRQYLGWDGAHQDLAELIFEKLVGTQLGWEPKDRDRALAAVHFTLLEEGSGGGTGPTYAESFEAAYGMALEAVGVEQAVRLGAGAIADYVRSIEPTNTAPWDAFAEMNRFDTPNEGEDPKDFAYGVWSRIGNQEGRRLIKRPKGFSADAYLGFRTFFRVDDVEPGAVGNCVTCHVPPNFTDDRFHNVGISELEYDEVHGAGSAAKLELPGQASQLTASRPTADAAAAIDLGRFNVEPSRENAGAFRTPGLRRSSGTDPYMHNGRYETLADAVRAHATAAAKARAGELPWADEELKILQIEEQDIVQLVAFLEQLNEVPREDFRTFLIKLADDELSYDW
ncbi:MAG: cytochrome c peroxidase [Acidobacteriota bacterium]